ncbi:MAG: hypothetical protein LC792_29995 [Actinobacteria bacterium]|nr:hypothetical protein [Actinomycetota bacterium]
MRRIRRFGVIAAFAVMAGLIGAAVMSASNEGNPAPIVWRDHVLDPTTTSTR